MTIGKRGLSFWAVLVLLTVGGGLSAEPINFFAGRIDYFRLVATPQGDGTVRTEIKFEQPKTTYINNGSVGDTPTPISMVTLTAGPIPVTAPLGQAWYAINPSSTNGSQEVRINGGKAKFDIQWGLASVYTDLPNPDGDNVEPMTPWPTTPQGPNGLTILGNTILTDNTTGLDFSPFGSSLSDGGLLAIQLQSNDPNTNMVDVLTHGGEVIGKGSFQQTGISSTPVGSGEVPEPTTLVVWAVTAAAGVVMSRRYGRKVVS